MKKLVREYFGRYGNEPVKIKPFDPVSKMIARHFLERLSPMLSGLKVELAHRGSTYFGIVGKGEIEVGVYPAARELIRVVDRLEKYFGPPGNREREYARFNTQFENRKIEIIVMGVVTGQEDRLIHEFLPTRPDLLKEYELLKRKYSSNRQDYLYQKHCFFYRVLELAQKS